MWGPSLTRCTSPLPCLEARGRGWWSRFSHSWDLRGTTSTSFPSPFGFRNRLGNTRACGVRYVCIISFSNPLGIGNWDLGVLVACSMKSGLGQWVCEMRCFGLPRSVTLTDTTHLQLSALNLKQEIILIFNFALDWDRTAEHKLTRLLCIPSWVATNKPKVTNMYECIIST